MTWEEPNIAFVKFQLSQATLLVSEIPDVLDNFEGQQCISFYTRESLDQNERGRKIVLKSSSVCCVLARPSFALTSMYLQRVSIVSLDCLV